MRIDMCGFMGESFCRRHPESRDDFVERVLLVKEE